MPQSVAASVFAVVILGLFLLDRDRSSRVSPALWIAVTWVFLAASRSTSEWLGLPTGRVWPDRYLDGSPLDRFVLTGLLAAGISVLVARRRRVMTLLRVNWPILLFFSYCGLSVLWSDYPDVAFKRWTKALGDIVMVFLVLSEAEPLAALKRLLAWTGFLLIPLSILFIKYYPDLGRGYNRWTWTPYYTGVSFGKNGLGYVCFVFGLAALWRLLDGLRRTERSSLRRLVLVQGTVLAMTSWLFWKADSATSLACFLLGGSLIAATSLCAARRPLTVHVLVGAGICLLLSGLLIDTGTSMVEAMGRDTSFTGRTGLWDHLLRIADDSWIGAGYESFWLGERVENLWRTYWWHPNQAHNGYLEIYLNLGSIGLGLLGFVIAWGYRNVAEAFRRNPAVAKLKLAYFIPALAYNMTEAAFRMMHPVWIALLIAICVPLPSSRQEEA